MGIKWKLQNPWYDYYYSAKARCENKNNNRYQYYGGKGIKFLMTLEDFKFLWFRDEAYNMKKPSIDRKNSNKNYTLENCQFIELKENCGKELRKSILQFDLNNKFLKEWESMHQVEKILGFWHGNISYACLGKYKQANGFIWKYKEK